MTLSANLWALVPAAGAGRRMGAPVPKQYLPLGGKTVLEITLEKLRAVPAIQNVLVAVAEDDERFAQLGCASSVIRVTGGAERADSVYRGLVWLMEEGRELDWVLVHDAARPCVRGESIARLIDRVLAENCGGILAAPVADTLKKSLGEQVTHTVSRDHLWAAHTPQMFRVGELFTALTSALEAGLPVTDEASAIEHAGGKVLLVADSRDNIKITQPEDLNLAEQILRSQRSVSRSG
ncbi:MAG: 2-C-methyl-D-erythritol 4-phosphate cytidylyltransferase [Cellvibrionaceae bacterium]|nr:2-C-methyl-D-erythritol 4-phosphate cytidylyltransferase [Cellvibrionaceae bacterium]